MPFTNANGIEIYYETAGSRLAPPLLLIQGITGYTEGWFAQIPVLQNEFYVINFDNRGAGRSTQSEPGYSMADMADDAAALLDALEIPQALVFGISMGGMIALNLAARHPQKVMKLALGCTTPGDVVGVWPDQKVLAAMTAPSSGDKRQDFLRNLWFLVAPGAEERLPDLIEKTAVVSENNPQTEVGVMGQFQAVTTHDVSNALADLAMPVLVMHGDADILIPFENGRYLAENIPGAEFEVYPNTGHLFHLEQVELVNQRLVDFFCS